jgi:PAT family beta-lactamase induction signal transducer AmpG
MMPTRWLSLMFQKRMLVILLLGIASGLPLALSANTLQAWFASEGVGIVLVGFLGLVGQPYAFKFLWAPLLDKYRLPYLGFRRGWILTLQAILACILVLMGFQDPSASAYQLIFLAVCLATVSATQDIVIDAYRTELLLPEERGIGASMSVGGLLWRDSWGSEC